MGEHLHCSPMTAHQRGTTYVRGACALVLVLALLAPASPASAWTALPPTEWVVGPQKRVVMLTFEGRTTNKQLFEVLATLEQKNAVASFFFPGEWVAAHRQKVRAVRLAGHTIGNRGYGPTPFTRLSSDQIRDSIDRAATALRKAGVYPRPFVRAPKGARNLTVLRAIGAAGYRSVRWTHHPGGGLAKRVKRAAVKKARAGSIISLDLWRKSHRRALPGIIDGLRDRSFRLKSIERLKKVHPVRWDVTLRSGSSGPDVAYLQKALNFTSYPAGAEDGSFGYEVLQAVYAYEKVHNMTRDGVVTPQQMEQIAKDRRPRAPKREPRNFVDIDISRQVLFEVRDRKVKRTIPISSGNEEYYTVDGQTYKAHTPRGNYVIERKIPGWRVSRLGRLWYPSYFVGGFAIHGSESVPTYPASHGCVRIPMYVTKGFYDRNPVGMPTFVHD